ARNAPAVFRPDLSSTFRIRAGNRTRSIGVSSGSSGVGSSSLIVNNLAYLLSWKSHRRSAAVWPNLSSQSCNMVSIKSAQTAFRRYQNHPAPTFDSEWCDGDQLPGKN